MAQGQATKIKKRKKSVLQRAQEQSGVAQFVFVGRVLEQFHCFRVGLLFLIRVAFHFKTSEGLRVVEEHPVGKRVLRVQSMVKRNVRQFVRQNSRETCFIWKDIDEYAADDDRVADGKRFQW